MVSAHLSPQDLAPASVSGLSGPAEAVRQALMGRLASGEVVLPMLPQVSSQVLAAASDPQVDAGKLSALMHKDPALAGQVLKIANSPAYQPRMPIVSLQQAVARLGLSVLTEIAFAASVQSGVFKVPGFEKELSRLWRHGLGGGAWAKEVARSRRFSVESAFLCGLLHGVGKPVVLQLAVDENRRAGGVLSPEAMRALLPSLLDELHGQAGLLLAKRWELPASVTAAIAHYREPSAAGAHVNDAQVAALSDVLAVWLIEHEGMKDAVPREHPAFAALNFYQDEIDALVVKADVIKRTVDSLTV